MFKLEIKNGARVAAAAGLGLALTFGAVPVVALAEGGTVVTDVTETTEDPVEDGVEEEAKYPVYIGDAGFSSLLVAMNAAQSGDTITLMADMTDQSLGNELSGKSLTLDLNGYDVSLGFGKIIKLNDGASLTVTDESAAGDGSLIGGNGNGTSVIECVSGSLTLAGGSIVNIYNGKYNQTEPQGLTVKLSGDDSSFTMTGGTVDAGQMRGIYASDGAHVSISGGTVKAEEDGARALWLVGASAQISGDAKIVAPFGVVLVNYSEGEGSPVHSQLTMTGGAIDSELIALSGNNTTSAGCSVNISGGSLSGDDTCIYWPMEGTLDISSGSFVGGTALEARMGTINISGGSFEGTSEPDLTYASGVTSPDGSALKVVGQLYGGSGGQYENNPSLKVSVTRGTFTSQQGNAISIYNAGTVGEEEAACSVEVSDAVAMNPVDGMDAIRVTSNESLEIKGGSISSGNTTVTNSALAQAAAMAQTSVTTSYESGKFTNPQTMYTLFSSLGGAVSNASTAEAGRTPEVTLLRDVTEDVTVPDSASVALDMNGKTLTGSVDGVGMLELTGSGTVIGQLGDNVTIDEEGDASVTSYVAKVGEQTFASLADALSTAANSKTKTVTLCADVSCGAFSIPAGVTLDGDGHTITCDEPYESGAFITAGADADGVTIRDLTVSIPDGGYSEDKEVNRHGIQFFANDGGALENVTVNGGNWTSVQVNGATGVTIRNCKLDPNNGKGAYAHVEYALTKSSLDNGGDTPSVSIGGTTFSDAGVPQVWADNATLENVKGALGDANEQDALAAIVGGVESLDYSDIVIKVGMDANGDTIETVVSEGRPRPVTPPSAPTYDVEVPESEGGKVTVSDASPEEGDVVVVTAEPDEGQEVRSVTVTGEGGEAVEVTDNGDGTFSFEMPAGDVTVEVAFGCDGGALCPGGRFPDVDSSQWYHDAVDWAVANGLVSGYGDGTFQPGRAVARAEAAAILWNAAGRPEAGGDLPADVPAGEWYAAPVAWALSAGVFSGNGDGSFQPGGGLTREQAACVLYNRAAAVGEDVSARADLSGFADASEVSGWAADAVSWAVAEGVLNGGAAGLEPGRALTRSELCAVLYNMEARA